MEDETFKEEELDANLPIEEEELDGKKKKTLDDVDSVDDLIDDELALDKDDLMDDVEEM